MTKIKANKRSIIRWKVYIDRARMYIGYIQFLMIVFVFFKDYKDSRIGQLVFDHPIISLPIIFLVFIILSLIVGRLDTVLGLREEELRNSSTSNPVMKEMLMKMDELKQEIKDLKADR